MNLFVLKLLFVPQIVFAQSPECKEWFIKTGVQPNSKNCEIECSSKKVGMSTFMCTEQCDVLCNPPSAANYFSYYIGLTADELALVAKNPQQALIVYENKGIAEGVVQRSFLVDLPDTESDAIRHFLWAAYLTNALGEEVARKYLDAHEAGNSPADSGTIMDKENNEAGIKAAKLNKKSKNFNTEVESKAFEQLKNGKLKVIRPGNNPRSKR